MKLSKVLVLAVVVLATSAAARTVLQQQAMPPQPQQCGNTWKPDSIECSFDCPATAKWDFKCEAQSGNVASCHVHRANANTNEDIYFICLITTPNQPPNCQQGVTALNVIPDPCITQNVNQILGAWPAAPK